jgi:hypothetical protein
MVADVVLYNGKVVTVDARESVAEAAAVLQVFFLNPILQGQLAHQPL